MIPSCLLLLVAVGLAPHRLTPFLAATGFVPHRVSDAYGREIVYYLSAQEEKDLPLGLFVRGSGGQSLWSLREGRVGVDFTYCCARSLRAEHGCSLQTSPVCPSASDLQSRARPGAVQRSFCGNTLRAALRTEAKLFIAPGTEHRSVPIAVFDVLRAELVARSKDVTVHGVVGAGHGLQKAGDTPSAEGIRGVFAKALDWFLRT